MPKFYGDTKFVDQVTFDSKLRLKHQAPVPTGTDTGFGRLYVDDSDGYLHFIDAYGADTRITNGTESLRIDGVTRRTTNALTLAVETSGNDIPTAARPAALYEGDYSAYPFATIQAAVDAVPNALSHTVMINVGDGYFAGATIDKTTDQTLGTGGQEWIFIRGTRSEATDISGVSSGTATSGTTQTLTLTGAGWTPGGLRGRVLNITAGAGTAEQVIAENTSDTITVAGPATAMDGTTEFTIENYDSIISEPNKSGYSAFSAGTTGGFIVLSNFKITYTHNTGVGVDTIRSNGIVYAVFITIETGANKLYDGFKSSYKSYLYTNNCAYIGNVANAAFTAYGPGSWHASYNPVAFVDKSCCRQAHSGNMMLWGGGWFSGADKGYYGYNGLKQGRTTLYNIHIENCNYGVYFQGNVALLYGADIDNCTTAIYAKDSEVFVEGTLTGSGNTGWGFDATNNPGSQFRFRGTTPTISGTSGEVTANGSTTTTWADFLSASPDYIQTGSSIFTDHVTFDNGITTASTTEDFTIDIDPVGGSDVVTRFLLNQADSTAHGAFASVEGAMAVLPRVNHEVTFLIADGYVMLDATNPFDGISRIVLGNYGTDFITDKEYGRFLFKSASGLVRVADTSTYAVSSSTTNSVILAADPGFNIDGYQSMFIRVVSGTGTDNRPIPIRYHTATIFTVPPHAWTTNLDGTSVIEIVEPAAQLIFDDSTFLLVNLWGNTNSLSFIFSPARISFEEIDINGGSARKTLLFHDIPVSVGEGARFQHVTIALNNSAVYLENCILDGDGLSPSAINFIGESFIRQPGSTSPWLARNTTGSLIQITPSGNQTVGGYLFSCAFDDAGGAALELSGPNILIMLGTRVEGMNNATYGVTVNRRSELALDAGASISVSGASGDILLDDDVTYGLISWAEAEAEVGRIYGPFDSTIHEK